jgi:hypothetical protein
MTSSQVLMYIATAYRINHHMLQVSLPIDYSMSSATGIRHENVAPARVRVRAASSDCRRYLELRWAQITISRSPVRPPTDVSEVFSITARALKLSCGAEMAVCQLQDRG